MLSCYTAETKAVMISLITANHYPNWLAAQAVATREWLSAAQFKPEPGAFQLLPDANGAIAAVICCIADVENLWDTGGLPLALPEGVYQFVVDDKRYFSYAIAWGLGAYQFSLYKQPQRQAAQLVLPESMVLRVNTIIESLWFARDCINIPTDDMGPSELAAVTEELAQVFNAQFTQIVGEELVKQNYASIYTVGRASDDAPRLLDLRWGNPSHPKVTLVGKGVCFDTGGLDLKSSTYMLLMKKDMAGGAHVLALARMIMQAKLPVRLRVLIPAVENAVSGNAYRPGDIIKSRKGLTVEIGNTDAEGRLVLSDALTEAASEKPDLLIDIATLTGAARVALGTDLPAVFSNNDELVHAIIQQGQKCNDPMWRLPLFAAYRESLNSPIADMNNSSPEPYAGAITAALFLKEFVPDDIPWLHFDMMAWNLRARPGRPQGGEALTLRALFAYLENRFGDSSA